MMKKRTAIFSHQQRHWHVFFILLIEPHALYLCTSFMWLKKLLAHEWGNVTCCLSSRWCCMCRPIIPATNRTPSFASFPFSLALTIFFIAHHYWHFPPPVSTCLHTHLGSLCTALGYLYSMQPYCSTWVHFIQSRHRSQWHPQPL